MALINERFNEPDSIEIVRNQLAAVLSIEMKNQYEMAEADEDSEALDYLATILIENDEPLQAGGDNDLFPLINVGIQSVTTESRGTASVNKSQLKAVFAIDCYQQGNTFGKFAGKAANIKAWKLARCVRRILDSDAYTYLRLRGLVNGKQITSMQSGTGNMTDSAVKVYAVRILLEVRFNQNSPQTEGVPLEILPVEILDENGQVYTKIREEEK